MGRGVLEQIRERIERASVAYRHIEHPPTYTSEESAAARGESLEIGGKALLLKDQRGTYRLFVMSAALKLDSGAIRKELGLSKLRFATAAELLEQTGLVPGSVPPFGEPILPFELFADRSVLANENIAFNAGSLTDSIVMRTKDWQQLASPRVFDFSVAAD